MRWLARCLGYRVVMGYHSLWLEIWLGSGTGDVAGYITWWLGSGAGNVAG
jgi:hypothetical protein